MCILIEFCSGFDAQLTKYACAAFSSVATLNSAGTEVRIISTLVFLLRMDLTIISSVFATAESRTASIKEVCCQPSTVLFSRY